MSLVTYLFDLIQAIQIMKSFFDIESGPLPDAILETVCPTFQAPANYKDPDKITAHIAEQKISWREHAALDPLTGEVLCVGIGSGLSSFRLIEGKETELLQSFWQWLQQELEGENDCIGFNTWGFDLPFMIRRSWILNVRVPAVIRRGRYWNDHLIDIMDMWTLGNREQRISLDNMAKAFGVGAKTGNGKDFAAMYRSPMPEKREEAIDYVKNDISLLRKCADQMLGGAWNESK